MSFFKNNLKASGKPAFQHKILLVDDEPANLLVLAELLGNHYQVLQALSGAEALQLLQAQPADAPVSLLLTDQRMPGMTGVELCQALAEQSPDSVRLIITGFIDVNAIIDAINQAGIYKFIVKPFTGEDLLLTLARAIEAYELKLELRRYVSQLEEKVRQRTAELEQEHQKLLEAYQKIEQLSLHDPLTGLGNRRYLQQRADLRFKTNQQAEAERRQDPQKLHCLLLLDIDHFKQVNDRYGHDCGDQVLVAFAAMLRQQCRDSDVLVRWGGEEFVVLAELNTEVQATQLASRILQACRNIRLAEQPDLQFSVSAGIAFCPATAEQQTFATPCNCPQLLQLADKALYQAKRNGRDQWVVATDNVLRPGSQQSAQ